MTLPAFNIWKLDFSIIFFFRCDPSILVIFVSLSEPFELFSFVFFFIPFHSCSMPIYFSIFLCSICWQISVFIFHFIISMCPYADYNQGLWSSNKHTHTQTTRKYYLFSIIWCEACTAQTHTHTQNHIFYPLVCEYKHGWHSCTKRIKYVSR